MQSFKLKFLVVTILQGIEFLIFLLIFAWAVQQCSATALPVMSAEYRLPLLAKTDPPEARSLCDSRATCDKLFQKVK